MIPPQATVAVDCFVRASSLVDPVDATVETLREYHRTGVIDELEVRAWPDEIPLTEATEGSDVVARYGLFRAWAEENGVGLAPAFARRERTTLVSDGTETVLVLPVVCLAVHVDGELADVVPHRDGTTTYTVDDALADLGDRATGPDPGARTPERCPDCGARLVTGQGLYACSSCSWTDVVPAEGGAAGGASDGRDDRDESDESGEPAPEDIDEQRPLPP